MRYFDNSATTPLAPEVKTAICHYMDWSYGNPSSRYREGQLAAKALRDARRLLAQLIGAKAGDRDHAGEVFFTSSGTEADNLAILGALPAWPGKKDELITSSIEHPAVLNTFAHLQGLGYKVTYLPVDKDGLVSLASLKAHLSDKTALVSIMYANNEIGSIQDVFELCQASQASGALFHTDAVQALGKIPIDVKALGVDLMSFSAHKVYGPKGVGAVYVRQGLSLRSQIYGGHQEYGRRPGTENMLGLVGFAKACELLLEEGRIEKEAQKKAKMARRLRRSLSEKIPHIFFNGAVDKQVAGHLSVTFQHVEGESLLMYLNLKDIACSSGSACSTGSTEPSHVLRAIGLKDIDAQATVRFSLGRYNTDQEIDYLVKTLPAIIKKLRIMSPLATEKPESGQETSQEEKKREEEAKEGKSL